MYLSGTAGYTVPDDPDVEFSVGSSGELDMDDGLRRLAGSGLEHEAFRVEAEAGYRLNDFDVSFPGGLITADGDLETLSGMVNLYYDFGLGDRWSIYIGGGVGAAYTTIDLEGETNNDTVLAYQGMVGVGYAFSDESRSPWAIEPSTRTTTRSTTPMLTASCTTRPKSVCDGTCSSHSMNRLKPGSRDQAAPLLLDALQASAPKEPRA